MLFDKNHLKTIRWSRIKKKETEFFWIPLNWFYPLPGLMTIAEKKFTIIKIFTFIFPSKDLMHLKLYCTSVTESAVRWLGRERVSETHHVKTYRRNCWLACCALYWSHTSGSCPVLIDMKQTLFIPEIRNIFNHSLLNHILPNGFSNANTLEQWHSQRLFPQYQFC